MKVDSAVIGKGSITKELTQSGKGMRNESDKESEDEEGDVKEVKNVVKNLKKIIKKKRRMRKHEDEELKKNKMT